MPFRFPKTNDKAAMDCLKFGDTHEALTIIQRKGNYSGVVNMAVLALILKRWDIALYSYAYLLESPLRRGALVKAFTDAEDYFSEDELVEYISNKLVDDFPNANWIGQSQREEIELGEKTYPFKTRFAESKLIKKLSQKCIDRIKKDIDAVLSQASSVSRNDAKANLRMAEQIEEQCKSMLKELRQALGRGDKVFIDYADKVANQILENCIAYYNNDANNPQRAKNVIKYTRYAYRTAEGKIAKERAKKNLDIINEFVEEIIPESIKQEYENIDNQVMYFKHNVSKIDSDELYTIVDYCCKQIDSIKDKIGASNKHYVSISQNFAFFMDQAVIDRVNSFLSRYPKNIIRELSLRQLSEAIKYLEWANSLYNMTAKYVISDDMDLSERNKSAVRYVDNRYEVINQLNIFKEEYSRRKTIRLNTGETKNSQGQKNRRTTNSDDSRSSQKTTLNEVEVNKKINHERHLLLYIAGAAIFIILLFALITKPSTSERRAINDRKSTPSSINDAPTRPATIEYPSSNKLSKSTTDYIINQNLSNYEFESEKGNADAKSTQNYQEETYTTVYFRTGDRPYQSTYGKGNYDSETENSLLIKNGSSTDAVVFLERLNGNKVRHVYIRRGENFTMTKIPGGSYIIKIMQGTDWNPDRNNGAGNPQGGFMNSRSISKSESYDTFDYPYPSSGEYYSYEVTLYKVESTLKSRIVRTINILR